MLENNQFDIDLKEGQVFEEKLKSILEKKKIETKFERDIWKTTKNICIELSYKNRPSGVHGTKAEYWFHIFQDNGDIKFMIAFPTDELKQLVSDAIGFGIGEVKDGGEGNYSKLLLIPLAELFKLYKKNGGR